MGEQEKNKKYEFPLLSFLRKDNKHLEEEQRKYLRETALRIQQVLFSFGIRVTVIDISIGPRFTQYVIQPEIGARVKDITKLENEIRIATAATDILIEAPIPGKPAIGIDIANKDNFIVPIREIIESKEFKEFPSNLAFAVGKDSLGYIAVADISKMPNVLIAGTTGSGKSVCINSIVMSILYKAHPNDVKLIMIDTKAVNLSVYNEIPHLLIPVVTDMFKSLSALRWVISEIKTRYSQFSDFGVRDLKSYNIRNSIPHRMPQILIVIDDLSDLMAMYKNEAEELIAQIARSSRNVGIHLVIATQRPSTDVVTGLIKSNIPSRIAFSTVSAIDSRVILDEKGAEKLLGNGDMLFKPMGYPKPARIQGAFVSDEEILDVVNFLKSQKLGNIYNMDIKENNSNFGVSNTLSWLSKK